MHMLEWLATQEKLELIARLAHDLQGVAPAMPNNPQQAALQRLRCELATLPVRNPTDGFSNRQHDDLLYGTP